MSSDVYLLRMKLFVRIIIYKSHFSHFEKNGFLLSVNIVLFFDSINLLDILIFFQIVTNCFHIFHVMYP